MRVDVKLFASLRKKLPPSSGRPAGKGTIELPDAATLADLIRHLDIPPDLAQMVLVNGEQTREFGRALTDGDQISIFPPVAGGCTPNACIVAARLVPRGTKDRGRTKQAVSGSFL